MPLTNAEKQKRARTKRADRIQRYEAALREIADEDLQRTVSDIRRYARQALAPTTEAK